jgi:hypothetical protein
MQYRHLEQLAFLGVQLEMEPSEPLEKFPQDIKLILEHSAETITSPKYTYQN